MKKICTMIGGLLCTGALIVPSVGWAAVMKEKAVYTYGDAMGDADETKWSEYDHNFFDKDGKKIRSVQLGRSVTGDVITVNNKTTYIYNDAGKLIESINSKAKPTSPENADGEFVFTNSRHDVWEYNEAGQLTAQYFQQWSNSKQDWNNAYKMSYYEYTYNPDGTVQTEKFWTNLMESNANEPNRTTTYEYDASGKVLKSKSVGKYASNCYDKEYTYDNNGRLIHTVSTCTLESSKDYNTIVEEKNWTYTGDFLSEVETITKNTHKRIRYKMVNNNPNRYKVYNESYNTSTEKWARNGVITEHVNQDFTGMELLIPNIQVSIPAADSKDLTVKFTLPEITYANYAVRIYRDGAEIKTYTKDNLSEIFDGTSYSFTDTGLTSGDHEYYAQLLVGEAGQTVDDMNESYISNIATAEVVIDYPKVTDFKIKGYTLKRTYVPESKDKDDGSIIPAYWQEEYKLVLEWTPLTTEQVEGYGFEKYEIYYKSKAGNTPASDGITDITTSTVEVDWLSRYTEVWLAVKYGEDRVETEHLAIDLTKLTDLSVKDPIPAYGVMYYQAYTPAFAKVDLANPETTFEIIYNLWDDNNIDWSSIFGGVSINDTYFALYDNYGTLQLGAFDMTNKKCVTVGKPYDVAFSDMMYDTASDNLYAVVPDADASYLYTIDRSNGTATKTEVSLPEYTLYLASAEEGKAYAMAAETGDIFQLYSIDLSAGTYSKVEGVTINGTQSTWSDLTYKDNLLYFNLNGKFFTIDLSSNIVMTNNDLYRGLSGIAFTMSSALPEVIPVLGEYSHMITTERSDEGMTNYFYNPLYNEVERISEFDSEGNMTKYSKNIFNEAGVLTTTEVYEPTVDDYGIESMQASATTTYTYNEEGLLTEKSNSDGTWQRLTYENGLIATESFGNDEITEKTLSYMYDEYSEHPDKPIAVMSASETDENSNYTAMFGYDSMGNKIVEYHVKDMMGGEYISFETWEYFENTNIVSAHNICVPNQFDEQGNPVVESSTKYMNGEEGFNHLISQEFDGEGNPVEGTAKELVYSDLTDTAESAFVETSATMVEGSANDVEISFGIPMLAYTGSNFSLDFYRDGIQIGQLSMSELSGMNDFKFTDKQVPNGKHEYFVRTNKIDINGMPTALQISFINEVSLDTELPAASDIAFVKYEEAYLNANGEVNENATSGDKTYLVTIGWKNPEIPEAYGFTGNHIFLMGGEKPEAAEVVNDAQIAETAINVGTATTFDVMIQSRYALGVANSEVVQLSFNPSGVDSVSENGFNVTVEGKSVIATEEATISVFSTDGTRVAATCGNSLDLSALNGTYVVTAERNGEIRIVKVIL